MRLSIPDFALVTLVGASGSGKSTFALKHFLETEIVSSDRCRALVADDETDQSSTRDAFDVLYAIVGKRLASRRLTVIDATNLRPEDRAKGIDIARKYHALPVAIVFDLAPELSAERNRGRANRTFGAKVVYDHVRLLRKSIKNLRREGYRTIYVLASPAEVDEVTIVREPLYNDLRVESGPFDIIGDVHGCFEELVALLKKLGYSEGIVNGQATWVHPEGRRAIFLGDVVDRGPRILDVLRLVMSMVGCGSALCVPGNHENKLARKLNGKNVTVSHGLSETLAQLDALPAGEREAFATKAREFIDGLVSHYWLDGGRLVVAHAGLRAEMHGRGSREVREFALYGETTGETDEFGLPVRYDWAKEYRGSAIVAYGHTPIPQVEWVNKTICLDTGCVYGGALTAMRYPELDFESVPALRPYADSVRPLVVPETAEASGQLLADNILDIEEVSGKRRIVTRFGKPVMVPAGNAAAALEVISRFCVDPRWLIYLPPTMSPSETSQRETLLEHPDEAFAYYRKAGLRKVVLEEKHMGSRSVLVIARNETAARQRFGVLSGDGVVVTRTGRAFFTGSVAHFGAALIQRVRTALDKANFWNRLNTDWVCLDAELMPWSAKAQELVDRQYAPVGEAAVADLNAIGDLLAVAAARGIEINGSVGRIAARQDAAERYVTAYQRYVRPVNDVGDLRLAPFHLLATEGSVHVDKPHRWHMEELARICGHDPILTATPFREVDLADEGELADAIAWWESMTSAGGEGVVVKPETFLARDSRGLLQPALKVRGREYLRIVYGPEYALPENMERLRERAVAGKRRLAMGEFTLGIEALHRFVERAPLRSIHECVFGVLALESEPIDPRL